MTDYDLRAAIEAVVMDSDLASPREIAEKVAGEVPVGELRAVLAATLTSYVRTYLGQRRNANPALSPTATHEYAGTGNDRRPRALPVARSRKVTSIREAWRAALRDRICVGEGQWQTLGQCSYGQLMYAAAERQTQANRNTAKAEQFRALAEKLKAHGVARVSDLPTAVLADVLPKAA